MTTWLRSVAPLATRVTRSTVVWSFGFNLLRLASGVFLLPLLLRLLSKPDLGMYYMFLSLNAIVIVLDLGFSTTIARFFSYAAAGATRLVAHGVARDQSTGRPNLPLLWELLITARVYYRFVTAMAALVLGTAGTFFVWHDIAQTTSPTLTKVAWAVSVAAVAAETYFSFWNVFLRGVDQVLTATKIMVLSYGTRLALACVFLLLGGGLLSLPAASLVTSFLVLWLSRRGVMHYLATEPRPGHVPWRSHLATIWPNSWRLGLYFAGGYLATNANVVLCTSRFGLEGSASYGLSIQVMNIVAGLAAVWTTVKWPYAGQLIARHDYPGLRKLLWPRVWLQMGSFAALAAGAVLVGPWFIEAIGKDKEMLPLFWMALLSLQAFMENHCTLWNTLIAAWNKLPMLWPSLATNAAALTLNLLLTQHSQAHPGWLIFGPLIAGLAFNYWYWPCYGARTLQLSWVQFLLYGLAARRHNGTTPAGR